MWKRKEDQSGGGGGARRLLEWYQGKDRLRSESFYDGSCGGDLLFRDKTKSLEVNSRVYRWKNRESKVCEVYETVEHLVLEYLILSRKWSPALTIVEEQNMLVKGLIYMTLVQVAERMIDHLDEYLQLFTDTVCSEDSQDTFV